MRYAIVGASVEQIRNAGGIDIKETRAAGITFATLDEAGAARLKALGAQVTPVGEVRTAVISPPVAPPTPVAAPALFSPEELIALTGFDYVRELTVPPLYGEGVNLAIVDTGIRESHQLVKGRVVYRKNLTAETMEDGFDHGTGVAAIAVAMAPKVSILNIKVLDSKGSGSEEDLVMGIDEVLTLHDEGSEYAPGIINLSVGSPDDGNPNNPVRMACREAIKRGIWINAAAGNSGPSPGTIMSPACERYVCAIGSCGYEPQAKVYYLSGFSSRGPTKEGLVKPDSLFFGESIVMASSISDTATVAKSGTSFSTPFCSGIGALYLEGLGRQLTFRLEQSPQIAEELKVAFAGLMSSEFAIDQFLPRISIKPQGAPGGKDVDYGYGLPFGPLVLQAMAGVISPAFDISALLSGFIAVAMMGMMVRAIE